jgi:hypothetical protein
MSRGHPHGDRSQRKFTKPPPKAFQRRATFTVTGRTLAFSTFAGSGSMLDLRAAALVASAISDGSSRENDVAREGAEQ